MDDLLVRLASVVGTAAVAFVLVRVSRRFDQPVHPVVDLAPTDLPTGVVLFTSTDCTNCGQARSVLQAAGVDFREVTWELEGRLMERVGITAVPLAVFRDDTGATVAQIAGVPGRRRLRRAVAEL